MFARSRLGLEAVILMALLAGCGGAKSASSASHSPSPEPSVSSASLLAYAARGSDLGAGWTDAPDTAAPDLAVDNGSHPCQQAYGSDSERAAKNGVLIRNPNDPSRVANDVTFYRGKGAQDALKDARRVLASCTNYSQMNNEGHVVLIDVHQSTANLNQLGDDRVLIEYRATLDSRSVYSVVFMVRVGKYLTTVFTVSGDPSEAGKLAGLAAAASTLRLKAAAGS